MLLENVSQYLLNFTGRIEDKGVVSAESAAKIRKYIRAEENPVRWELFLILSGLIGAVSISAGVFAITSHNWYDFPVMLRWILSYIPVVVALYFYYRMLTKHRDSKVWIEVSSLFLMLMIGASIAISSQIYHMSSDYSGFLKVMLLFTIPLFYIVRASSITLFYLIFATMLLFLDLRVNIFGGGDDLIEFGSNSYWYWFFIAALLPHYYMTLNKDSKEQGLRTLFLTLIIYAFLYVAIMASIDSNRLLWSLTYNVGFYIFAKRYMDGHFWFLSRIISWLPQLLIAGTLLSLSNKILMGTAFRFDSLYDMDDWDGGQWYYFVLVALILGGIYYNYFKAKQHFENVNQLILFSPIYLIFLMTVDEYIDTWWISSTIANLYIILLAIVVMVNGSEEGRAVKVLGGLALIAVLFGTRYFDMTAGFIYKGLFFIGVGAVFFMINMFMKEKVDQIKRFKN